MEKKRVKLLELFNADSNKYSDLADLYVTKVDIYKAKASVNIILEGVDTLSAGNSLVSFVEELEEDFGTKVTLRLQVLTRRIFSLNTKQLLILSDTTR